jgi:hypothetical protein
MHNLVRALQATPQGVRCGAQMACDARVTLMLFLTAKTATCHVMHFKLTVAWGVLVAAGVVSRPGDADFIPSELAALWKRCGDIW